MIAKTPTINAGPVLSAGRAGSITEAQTSLPSMRETITGWFKPMIIGVVTTSIVSDGPQDGTAKESVREARTSGMLQPGKDETLKVSAEGERSWKFWILHVFPQLDVETDARLKIKGKYYRVLARKDFTANGFIRYGLVEDYQ